MPVDVASSDLRIQGITSGLSIPLESSGFQYDPATFTATWSLATPLAADSYVIRINSDDVSDDQVFQFHVVPGDVNADGVTDAADDALLRSRMFLTATHPNYSTRYDLDGSGVLNVLDGLLLRNRLNSTLPTGSFDLRGPVMVAELLNDTAPDGETDFDTVTSDPTIVGAVYDPLSVTSLTAQLNEHAPVPVDVQQDGSFEFDPLDALPDLADGDYVLQFRAKDGFGNPTTLLVHFTLDRQGPLTPTVQLSAGSAVVAAGMSSASRVTLVGVTDPNVVVHLLELNLQTVASATGYFQFTSVHLSDGDNLFTTLATDRTGNTTQALSVIRRVDQTTSFDPVIHWNQSLLEAVRVDASAPTYASRAMAMVHAAIYDAVAGIEGTPAYNVALTPPAASSIDAAVTGAAHRVLSYVYPGQQTSIDAAESLALSHLPNDTATAAGRAFGQQIADAIITLRTNDGWDAFVVHTPAPIPGAWQATSPMFAEALDPQWAYLQPFVLDSGDQFRPVGPPSLLSEDWAIALAEVEQLGRADSSVRSAEQTEIARFWADGPGTITPPGHWNQIAQVAATQGSSVSENARLFLQLNLAMADAAIAAWDAKYHFDFWRPVTAIAAADSDGNDLTSPDPTWLPLLISPPFPDYISGHSTFSGAAATVLAAYFGDEFAFEIGSPGLLGVTRSFASFQEAAEEAGRSRIYGGIHYEFANQDGLDTGRAIGNYVLDAFAGGEDTQGPRIAVTSHETEFTVNANFTLAGRVLDNLSGVATLTYQLDDASPIDVAFDATGQFFILVTLPTSNVDGPHRIRLSATDAAGNISAPLDLHFSVDTLAPTIAIETPGQGDTLSLGTMLIGMADGTGSPLVQMTYSINGGQIRPIPFSPQSGSFAALLDFSAIAAGQHVLTVTARDAAGNTTSETRAFSLEEAIPLTVREHLPLDGAVDVGATFRPQVFFSRPVDPASLNGENFFATGPSGERLTAKIVPALDGTFAWLFLDQPMPGSAKITVHLDGSSIHAAADGALLDANGDGVPGGVCTFTFTTVSLTPLVGTTLSGKVVDPGPDLKPMTFDDIRVGPDQILHTADDVFLLPIAGVKVYFLGLEEDYVFTDANGHFHFDRVPAGNAKLVIDGHTATNPPEGFYFPEMVMDITLEAGRANTVMGTMGKLEARAANRERHEVYLPRLHNSMLRDVNASETTLITVDAESARNLTPEQRARLTIEIPVGSLIDENGNPVAQGQVGISTVPPELVREMLPPGLLQHTFDITIQAPGITHFATPAPMTFPNLFGAEPGTQLNFLSFDHTTGRLVIEGTATVSPDGLTVSTDPGTGVTHPGWHGFTPSGGPAGPDRPPEAPRQSHPVIPQLQGVADLVLYDDTRALMTFANAAAPAPAGVSPAYLIVTIEVDPEVAHQYLDGLRSQQFALKPGQSKQIQFTFKTPNIKKLVNDVLIGARFVVTLYRADVDGKAIIGQETYYAYRYVDAMDSDSKDGTLEFPHTINDDFGGLLRQRTVTYRGDPGALPTLAFPENTKDFYVTRLVPSEGLPLNFLNFDPQHTAENLTAPLRVITPSAIPRIAQSIPAELHVLGTSVEKRELYFNLPGLEATLEQLATSSNNTQMVFMQYSLRPNQQAPTGKFVLTYKGQRTEPLDVNAGTDAIRQALEALSTIGVGNVEISESREQEPITSGKLKGGTLFIVFRTIRFVGALADERVLLGISDPLSKSYDVGEVSFHVNENGADFSEEERQLIDTPEKRAALAQDVFAVIQDVFAQFGDTVILHPDASGGKPYNITWTTTSRPIYGEADVQTDFDTRLAELIKTRRQYNFFQQHFLLARAFQGEEQGGVEVYVDNHFETPYPNWVVPRELLVRELALTAAHELGHSLGLPHSALVNRVNGSNEIQVLTLQGGTDDDQFSLTFAGETTSMLPRNATPEDVYLALWRLQAFRYSHDFVVEGSEGGPYFVFFANADTTDREFSLFWAVDVPELIGVGTGSLWISTETLVNGGYDLNADYQIITRPFDSQVDETMFDIMAAGTAGADLTFQTLVSGAGMKVALRADWTAIDAQVYISALHQMLRAKQSFFRDFTLPAGAPRADLFDFAIIGGPALVLFDDASQLAPDDIDFDFVSVGSETTKTFELVNLGDEDATIRSVRITRASDHFSVTDIPVTVLRPGETLSIDVTFAPQATISAIGTLSISSNLPGFNGVFDLMGRGQVPNEAALRVQFYNNVGAARVGQQANPTSKPTIINDGVAPLTITEVRMAEGRGADEYSVHLLQPLPVTLQPGESYIVDYRFQPSQQGLRPGAFEIVSDDPHHPLLRVPVVGTGVITNDNFITFEGVDIGNNYVAVNAALPFFDNLPVLRTVSDDGGNWEFFLPQRTAIQVTTFDPVSGLVAHGYAITGPSGERTTINVGMFRPSQSPDSDGDGIPDDIEFAIGTSPDAWDSDGDGISDFDELFFGGNPLDDRPTVTGIVSALNIGGIIHDIELAPHPTDSSRILAYLANGSNGFSIVDVTNFSRPVELARLPLVGSIEFVDVDPERNLAAVLTRTGVIHLIDVSAPESPRLIDTVRGEEPTATAGGLVYFDGVFYVGLDNTVHTYDSVGVLDSVSLGTGQISGLSRYQEVLYATVQDGSSNRLQLVDIASGLALGGSVPLHSRGGVPVVADNLAWVPTLNGLITVDVTNVNAPQLIDLQPADPIIAQDFALNGSGLGIVAAGGGGSQLAAVVLRTSNPSRVDDVFTQFTVPDTPRSVVLSAGLAYVGDERGRLHVVNYLSPDQTGVPPQIDMGLITGDIDPVKPGLQFFEASTIVIPARITDNVQIRTVELLVNGSVVRTELSYPYDLSVQLPTIAASGNEATLQLRATDTGGNVRLSNPIVIQLVRDETPPQLLSIDPPDGSLQQVLRRRISLQFSESLDPQSAVPDNFVLVGPDGELAPQLFDVRQRGSRVEIVYAPLGEGNYELVIRAAQITDRSGNPLAASDLTTSFRIASVSREPTIRWINESGGQWSNPDNWIDVITQAPRVPTAGDDVLIDVPGDPLITFASGTVEVNSIVSNERFEITGGRLTVAESIQVNNNFLLRGPSTNAVATFSGTVFQGENGEGLTIAGHSRLDAATIQTDIYISENGTRLRLANGLALLGTMTVSSADASIGFEGPQLIASGLFRSEGATPTSTLLRMQAIGPATVTFGPDVEVRGNVLIGNGAAFSHPQPSALHLINQGTLIGEGASNARLETNGESLTNHGTIRGDYQSRLILGDKTWTNTATGQIIVHQTPGSNFTQATLGSSNTTTFSNAGTIELDYTRASFNSQQTWSNTGTILVDESALTLNGGYTTDDLLGIRNNGTVTLNGIIENTGRTFTFNEDTQSFALFGRMIGGTLVMTGPNQKLRFNGGTLDGVTIIGDIDFGDIYTQRYLGESTQFIGANTVTVVNGLTLHGTATIYQVTSNVISFQGPQTVSHGTFQFMNLPQPNATFPNGIQAFGGGPVIFDSTVTFRGTNGRGVDGNIISYANVVIDPGGSIRFGGINHVNPAFSGPFINRGTITVPDNAAALLYAPFINEGQIVSTGGTIRAFTTSLWQNTGVIDLTHQGRLIIDTPSSVRPTLRTADLGTILDSGGFVTLQGNLLFDNTDSTLVIDGAADWTFGSTEFVGGTIQVASTATLRLGPATLRDVVVEGDVELASFQTVSLVGDLTFRGEVKTLPNPSGVRLAFGHPTLAPNQPVIIREGRFDLEGMIPAAQSSGPVTLHADVVLRGRNTQATLTGPITNYGQIVSDAYRFPNGVFDITAAPVTNFGTLAAETQTTLRIANLAAPSEGIVAASPGSSVHFTSNFAQASAGTTSLQIAGIATNQVGRVIVGGAASLAGTLDVQFVESFVPAIGDRFEVMTFASLDGVLDTIHSESLPAGVMIVPEYNTGNLTLVVVASAAGAAQRAEEPVLTPMQKLQAALAAALTRWREDQQASLSTTVGTARTGSLATGPAEAQAAALPESGTGAREVIFADDGLATPGWFESIFDEETSAQASDQAIESFAIEEPATGQTLLLSLRRLALNR